MKSNCLGLDVDPEALEMRRRRRKSGHVGGTLAAMSTNHVVDLPQKNMLLRPSVENKLMS